MSYRIIQGFIVATLVLSAPVFANLQDDYDAAEQSVKLQRKAYAYDSMMCVSSNRNNCISEVCIQSEDRGCEDKCQQGAVAKCQLQGF